MNGVNLKDLALIVPEMILVVAALLLIVTARRFRKVSLVAAATVLATLACAVAAVCLLPGGVKIGFAGMITIDGYSQFFKLLIAAALTLATLMSTKCIEQDCVRPAEYHALLLLASTGMMFAASAIDLLTLYLSLELTTICSYILVGITVDRPQANEAGIKYFLLGSFASALFLYGISLT